MPVSVHGHRDGARWAKLISLLVVAIVLAVGAALVPRFGQPEAYHAFADARSLFGIPRFGDVASNLAYLIAGAFGLVVLFDRRGRAAFRNQDVRWPAAAFFVGAILVTFGSGYYHWEPTTARLYWDRLSMTVAFTPLVALFFVDRVNGPLGVRAALPLLVLFGVAGVTWWHLSEQAGVGDLRPYFLVQALCVVFIPLMVALFPGRFTTVRHVIWIGVWYGAAIVCEQFDRAIFEALGGLISGHTIKHMLSAGAVAAVAVMLRRAAAPTLSQT